MVDIYFIILPFAVGIAISPVPIITVILSLFSARAKWNGPAFIAGWALGILVVSVPVLLFTGSKHVATSTDPSTMASVIRIILGVVLLFSATRQWRKRSVSGDDVVMPKWLGMIDGISPLKVMGVGFVFADLTNPKNTALTIAGTLPIARSGLPTNIKIILVAGFVIVSCAGVAIPVIYYFAGGQSAKKVLNGWKTWLVVNNSLVMATMFLVFGLILLYGGVIGMIH